MANWNEFCASAKRAADKAIQKTGEIADVASMHIRLKSLESKRDEQYKTLGKMTYRQLKTGESQAEQIASVIEKLDQIRDKIRIQVAEIEAAKEAKKAAKAQKTADPEGVGAIVEAEIERAAAEADAE